MTGILCLFVNYCYRNGLFLSLPEKKFLRNTPPILYPFTEMPVNTGAERVQVRVQDGWGLRRFLGISVQKLAKRCRFLCHFLHFSAPFLHISALTCDL